MQTEYTIYAYQKNQIQLYSVKDEADSRTLIFNIVEKSGVVIPTSNAKVTNRMLDLTGYDIKLYVLNSDKVSVAGTITDAENGQVKFILSSECSSEKGEFECMIILTKNSEDLRIVGIKLTVIDVSEESYELSITAGESDGINITVFNADKTLYTLKSGDKLIFGAKRNLTDNEYALKSIATSVNKNGDGYDILFTPKDTVNLNGDYLYDIALQMTAGSFYHIIQISKLTVSRSVTQKE